MMLILLPQAHKINWKSDDKTLTKLYPRETDDEDENDIADTGSFFNFFEGAKDYVDVRVFVFPFPDSETRRVAHVIRVEFLQVGPTIANEVFPDAIQYFTGAIEDVRTRSEPSQQNMTIISL